jgi:YggT family protein
VGVFLGNLIQFTLIALWLLILGRVLISWVDPMGRSQIGAMLINTTEPILAPIRRLIPPMGGIDLGPLLLLIVLSALWRSF